MVYIDTKKFGNFPFREKNIWEYFLSQTVKNLILCIQYVSTQVPDLNFNINVYQQQVLAQCGFIQCGIWTSAVFLKFHVLAQCVLKICTVRLFGRKLLLFQCGFCSAVYFLDFGLAVIMGIFPCIFSLNNTVKIGSLE